jgi:DNA-binding CsgD family transcriptional regulator
MLCRDAASNLASGAVSAALRRVQPLVEIAVEPDAAARGDSPSTGDSPSRGLTPRERSVVALVVSGAGNVEIAAELGIARTTVRNHMSRILRKFGVRTRAQLIATYLASEESRGEDVGPLHEFRDIRMNSRRDR